MTTNITSSAIDTQLGHVPSTSNQELFDELLVVYSAIQILQSELSKTGRFVAKAEVTITAGQYVAAHLVAGTTQMRLANATDNTKWAVGFALGNYTAGNWGVFASLGDNQFLTGLTVGSQYYLDTTGGAVSTTKPVGAGKIVQPIGFALTATELITNIASNWTQL